MRTLDRLIAAAARRWPADVADDMAREWQAGLNAIRADQTLGRTTRIRRSVTFAGSIALSPAVEERGAEPATWGDRAAELCRPSAIVAAVTLLAAALSNVVHLAYHEIRPTIAGALGVLAAAAVVMVTLAMHARAGAVRTTVLLAPALFGFLVAGNQVAVMPFMGWVDVLPAVVTWAVLTAAAAYGAARLIDARRRRLGIVAGVGGGLLALDLATVAGSLHAAHTLNLGLGQAPWWLPLSLLPGGGPAQKAPFGLLLGNASAMAGPLLLCSIYVIARAVARPRRRDRAPVLSSGPATALVGAGGGLLALAACEMVRRSTGTLDAPLHRLLDHSTVFGFGFLAYTPGRIALALLIGLLIADAATGRTSRG